MELHDKQKEIIFIECGNCNSFFRISPSRINTKRFCNINCYNNKKSEISDIGNLNKTHGLSNKHYLYNTWKGMRKRCNNLKDKAYKNYGGRGIKVCDEWDNFETFIKDMGEKPSDEYSIDRIDNNKGYSKANCKWSTKKEQALNRRSNKR